MTLKGKKVILRPIRLSDASRFVRWLANPKVNQYTTRKPITLKEERKWIRSLSKKKNQITLAIDIKDQVHIGSIDIRIDKQDKEAVFGILIGDKRYWDMGYGFEASHLIIDYAFKKLKLHRIYLRVYEYNKRAIKLYAKLGFTLEGVGRESVYYQNRFYDQFYMGILQKEWRKIK